MCVVMETRRGEGFVSAEYCIDDVPTESALSAGFVPEPED